MKLLRSTESKITKNENGENVSHLDFSYIQVWFTDQNSKPSELEDKIIITLVIN